MALKDMSMKPGDYESKPLSDSPAREVYPYGLRISLSEPELKNLGIKSLPEAGESISLKAVAKISSVSKTDSAEGNSHRHIELQITHLDMSSKKEVDPEKIYDSK